MDTTDWPAAEFQAHRAHLRAVAYRMLGSLTEADDAVQEAWLRLSRTDADDVRNMRAWLTTVVSRVCLDMLRTRVARREDPLDVHVPDPVVTSAADTSVRQGMLESANVNPVATTVGLITVQREAEMLQRVLNTFYSEFDHIAATDLARV